jgi:hypothetical protein
MIKAMAIRGLSPTTRRRVEVQLVDALTALAWR